MKAAMLLITLPIGMLLAPFATDAQQAGKVARVGVLFSTLPRTVSFMHAFEQRLPELGYKEGENLVLDFRTGEGQLERLPDLATELVRFQPDVILAPGPEATLREATRATGTIPIVMIAIDYDPLALGYVAGLARPGGSVTGIFFRQLELTGKRLQLLKEAHPAVTRVGVLWDAFSADQLKEAEAAARSLGMQLQPLELRHPPDDYERAFETMVQGGAEAFLSLASSFFARDLERIVELTRRHRLPAMLLRREAAEVGGLMSHGVDISAMWRRAAEYVDRILKGAKPGDLPVEQPTKYELVINIKAAKELGLTIPPLLLFQADEVIR